MIELIYALQLSGCINDGHIELKEVTRQLGQVLNYELKDYYNTYRDICQRKKDSLPFLKYLYDILLKRIKDEKE